MSQRAAASFGEGRLEGKVALVTGAASGIGFASAFALAREGARVVVVDIAELGAKQAAAAIADAGGEAIGVIADVAEEGDVEAAVVAAVETYGGLDIVHNNAAASAPEIMGRDLDIVNMDVEIWDRVMGVNLRGVMLGCKHAIPRLIERGGGSIVNTSSAAGLTGDLSRPAYGASKAGVNSLTQNVATLYGKRGIRCNAIAPGVIETPSVIANLTPELVATYAQSTLTPRLGRPEDIANAVVFLASDESAFITGQVLSVDGGMLSHHPTYAAFSENSGS
jgi:NAD(P)-dependent dehydrogenase (short-subunit alcohol dehydrogenase family)